ncbi:MAG: RloB family protein, partial [Victivallaceae bacterium]|nr:RloB family protein [Victivallaceae bacterium]
MPPTRRTFKRQLGTRRYKKLFVIAAEGCKTEPQYFAVFNDQDSVVKVNCLKGKHGSAPPQVLARMERHIKKEGLKNTDEAWLVVDKDSWTDEQLMSLHTWSEQKENFGFALNNPKFEYWLLLHFDDGNGISSSRMCSERLERYIPGYDKGLDIRKISLDMINEAIARARNRDNPPCEQWPQITGTTVYRLVENILNSKNNNG